MEDNIIVSNNKFELSLANFNGPLDFLLELVKINKIEIRDIFISEVTEQFMSYMSQLADLNIDQASEYMAIAATLLEIKSKTLLPTLSDDKEEESPENVLLKQLEEYKLFKEIVQELKEQETVDRFYRDADPSVRVAVEVPKSNITMESFMLAFGKFLAKAQSHTVKENVSRAINKENFNIMDKIAYVQSALAEYGVIKFSMLFLPTSSKLEIIVTFSAILEMLKSQLIKVVQKELFEDFEISQGEGEELNINVEDTIDGQNV